MSRVLPGGGVALKLEAGDMIAHYRVAEKLGEGGMGVVYRALDTKLNRNVALKLLPAHLTSDAERRLRFQREAQATAALQHPNIAVIYEVGEHEGMPFLAMEFVEGRSLRAILDAGAMITRDWLRTAIPLADGIAHAHAHGVVHRDLKPDNVLVTADHQVKILDFGLAKLLDLDVLPEGSDTSLHTEAATMSGELTRAGQVFGTAAYMSPEQARGAPVDHRADIFALGVLLYECASGKRPFHGASRVDTLHGVLHSDPPPLSSLSDSLPAEAERVVRKSMEKDPEHRYQHADELATDLRTLQRDLDSGRVSAPQAIPTATPWRGRPPWLTVAGVVLVAGIMVAAIAWFATRDSAQRAPAATSSSAAEVAAERAIAVVGFENLEDAQDTDHLGRMLMALVTTDLAESGGLAVVSMPKVLAARQQVAPDVPFTAAVAAATARHADAQLMLVGQVGRVGQRLLLTTELIDVSSGQTLGSVQKTANSVDDLFSVAGDIGASVRDRLGQGQAPPDAFDLARSLTASGEAYRHFAAGEIALHHMHFAEAITQFDKAVREDPSFALAHYKRAVALNWAGRDDESVAALNAGLEHIDRLPPRWKTVFETYRHYSASEIDQAYAKLVAFLEQKPDIPDAYYTLGEILTHESAYSDWRKAREMFETALELDPSYRVVLFHLIEDYLLAQDIEAARELVDRMLELDPDGASIKEAEATVLAAEGRLRDAIAVCERELARGSDFVMMRLAYFYVIDGQLDRAIETANDDLQRHLKMGVERGSPTGLRWSARGMMRIAKGELQAGVEDQRVGAALMLAGRSYSLASRAYVIQSAIHRLSGDDEATRSTVTEALAADSLYLPAHYAHLRLAIESQNLDEARGVLARVTELAEQHPTPLLPVFADLVRCEIALATGDLDAADRALAVVRDALPEYRAVTLVTPTEVRLHLANGNLQAAIDAYRDLLQHCTQRAFYSPAVWIPVLFEVAQLEERVGDTHSAQRHYEQFLFYWDNADLPLPSVVEARASLAALERAP